MNNKLIFTPNTIILTIGVSNCGKSYFCENHLIPFFKSHDILTQYLSTDNIRRTLLGETGDTHKHSQDMLSVSKQAFSIFHNLLDNYTQYPINTPVIIADATNLSAEARKQIFDIAKKNHYNVVGLLFDFTDRENYYKNCDETSKKSVIRDQLFHFKEKTLPNLEKRDFKRIYTIKDLDFDKFNFVYEESNIEKFDTSKFERYCVFTDPHGCLDEVIDLVTDDKGISYNKETGLLEVIDPLKYHHHILNGDYIDKGPQTKEMIKFLFDNKQFFTIVRGNHENFVYKFLKGELGSYEKQKDIIDQNFPTCLMLQDDEEYKQMFFDLFENSFNYVKGNNFIVTHAPCNVKYLGKDDDVSIKNQRNIRYPKQADFPSIEEYLDYFENFFSFINEEAAFNQPFHFFGHVAIKDSYTSINKYNLDTGCVYGNKLTSASIHTNSKKPFIKSYSSKQPKNVEKLHLMFRVKTEDRTFSGLDPEVQRRLFFAAKNKLNFISGTMSPVDKEENDLESLKQGLLYYYKAGVKRVILQPKFMGSRANLLLHKDDVEKCKAFSRQGFQINNERLTLTSDKSLTDVFKEMQKKYFSLFNQNHAEYILFDGELLPWNVMGKALIAKDFLLPKKALESEIQLLKNTGFEDKLNEYKEKMTQYSLTPVDSLSEYAQRQMRTWKRFENEMESLETIESTLRKYSKQLDIFAQEQEIHYKPFSILKIIRKDGSEENFVSATKSNIEIFDSISDSSYLVVDFESKEVSINCQGICTVKVNFSIFSDEDSFNKMYDFILTDYWQKVTIENQMEGVVIKPEFVYVNNLAPYLKCRNKEYLRLIYGPDYDTLPIKISKLINGKNIKYKLLTSIKEWELGKKLLDIPMSSISIDNKKWVFLSSQLISEQDNEVNLDPRL